MLFRIYAGRYTFEQWLQRRFPKKNPTPTGIKQAYLYYTTSFLIRFRHEREIANIIHLSVSAVRDHSTHEYCIDEFPSRYNKDMNSITRCYTYELPKQA
jgi:hypothetical protein